MIEFLRRLFGHQGSSTTAKERLRLVLMTDHLELAPDMIDRMKRELVDVISRFVEVDRERIDVTFERQDSTLAMLANIPILSVTRPSANGSSNGNGSSSGNAAPTAEAAAPAAQAPPVAPAAAEAAKPPSRKRRRKKKAAQSAAPAPAH
jgi:cell division topological specificity factor